MAKINKQEFIKDLLNLIEEQIAFGESLLGTEEGILTLKENPQKWNALECIQHMNQSMLVYTDQLDSISPASKVENEIKIGWKGKFFAEGMRPTGEQISYKMKTMDRLDPKSADQTSISNFISLLELMKSFIEKNSNNDWTKSKVNTALGPLVKLNIAEAINFVLAHNERHILQAKKAMAVSVKV